MNGAHDLGGMHGFGPIDPEPEAKEPIFHAGWERRAFAITLAAGAHGKWNIDMSRHARERQNPADYLRHSYYENWIAGLETLLIEAGLVSEAELASGKSEGLAPPEARERAIKAGEVAAVLAKGSPTTMDIPLEAKFAAGDRVRVRNINPAGHTRAPRYARGKLGRIHEDHGVHIFADKNAHGTKQGQHLYSVRFDATELWGQDSANKCAVYIDLWDDHLEPAS
ncbi:MAG: nitrile hydratase subunit beta [Alphaproteobacteria bacterium]